MEVPKFEQRPMIQPQRTFILWFMSICSMLDAVFSVCSYLMFMFIPATATAMLNESAPTLGVSPDQVTRLTEALSSVTAPQFMLLIAVECLMFAGVLLMLWKLNQIGFHLYTIGQLLNICILNFVIGGEMAMNFDSIITVIFLIIIYAMQLRYMHRLEKSDETPMETEDHTEDSSL